MLPLYVVVGRISPILLLPDTQRLLKLLSERGLAKPEEVIKWVALEQFLSHFPTGTLEWVQCHQPGSLAKATQLVEEASKNEVQYILDL